MFFVSLSTNIRLFRKRAGLTQIDLARDVGVSIATLRRWEAGETAPTGTRIAELARCLNVSPEEIVALEPEAKSKNASATTEGMLVFENAGTRVELPPTEKGYELFNRLVDNLLNK